MNRADLLSPRQIQRLGIKHRTGSFNPVDEALIVSSGFAYWTLSDLSFMKVADLISESGILKIDGETPSEYNAHGKRKYFFIGQKTHFQKVLEKVIEWRLEMNFGLLDRGLYRGLNPESRFFLRSDGSDFEVTYRDKDKKPTLTQPTKMQRRFRQYFLGEGVNYQTLNNSFIINIWKEASPFGQTDARKLLIQMTGLTAKTLKAKTIREQFSIQHTLEDLYR